MIRKRAEGGEYHYEFMQNGRRYYGVCEGCQTERTAQGYEKRIRETAKKAAEQKSHKAIIENFKKELTGGGDIELESAFDLYLSKPAKRHPSVMRIEINRRRWNDFVAFASENYPDIKCIDQVASKHAEEYINYLRTKGRFIREVNFSIRTKKGKIKTAKYTAPESLSPRTINEYQQQCKSVFERLKDDAGIVLNPFAFQSMRAKAESRDAFSMEELQTIGDNLNGFCRPLFIVGICTGLTLSDVCLLKWGDIRNGWIVRRRNKTGAPLEIPMLPPLVTLIDEQRQLDDTGDYVFPEHATMYQENRTGVSYRIRKFLNSVGIETTRKTKGARAASCKDFHSLRHTFAYIAGVYQIPLAIVQSILGHMTPEMTKHYQEHATREDKKRYMQQLPVFLGAKTETVTEQSYTLAPEQSAAPERDKLKQLADTLPLETVKKILKTVIV